MAHPREDGENLHLDIVRRRPLVCKNKSGMSAAEVQALIDSKPLAQQMAEDDENLPPHRIKAQAMAGNQNASKVKQNGSSDRTSVLPRGETASYLVRRLKRDRHGRWGWRLTPAE
jgi:hypothetical protein